MIRVLLLAHMKVGSFGGLQSFLSTLCDYSAAHPDLGLSFTWDSSAEADLIHSHNTHLDPRRPRALEAQKLAAVRGIPHLLTMHDVPWIEHTRQALLPLGSSALATQSKFNQQLTETMIGRRPELLPVGIDFSRFDPSPAPEPRTIAAPGRLAPNKGGLEALKIAGQCAPARLLLSDPARQSWGQTPAYLEELASQAQDWPGLDLEFVSDPGVIPRIYQRAGVTLFMPLAPEGFGLVPLESLACGRPVVTHPNGGMTEWLTGLPGVRLDASPASIQEMWDDWPSWHAAALQARVGLAQRFDIPAVFQAHLDLYRRLL